MNAETLQHALISNMAKMANKREPFYLGMSGIGGCSREQYFKFTNPKRSPLQMCWYNFTGHLHESGVKALLNDPNAACQTITGLGPVGSGLSTGAELVADFDNRYRGHVDYELPGQPVLVEVKTVYWEKWVRLVHGAPVPGQNYDQVQAYLTHGKNADGGKKWERAILVYIARDIPHKLFSSQVTVLPPFHCVDVYPDPARQLFLDSKARDILTRIDHGDPPDCTCSWCRT